MKKFSAVLLVGTLGALNALATPLSPHDALSRIKTAAPLKAKGNVLSQSNLVYTARTENGVNGAYIFNLANGGFVIAAADDVAFPVLGYSDSGSIDSDNMSPSMKYWLDEYSRQIEWAVNNGVKTRASNESTDPAWTAITPMVTTKWNQDAPYNDQCPQLKSGGPRCYAGCVAISMAQVMKYHNYPERGEGLVHNTDKGRPSALSLGSKPFEWDKMLNVYSSGNFTEEEADAVAYLVKACGYTTNMKYGTTASGTSGVNVASALRTYFNYDPNCHAEYRLPYSSSEWAEKIYNNLKNVGPLVLNGQSPFDGGHSFVCDGYDGKGYFHINWGWGGYSDGYYLLDALNPDAQGIGGAAGGFNFSQNAIFGIQPPTGGPVETIYANLLQWGTLVGSLSGNSLVFSVKDFNPLGFAVSIDESVKLNIGGIIEPVDGTSGSIVEVKGTTALGDIIEISTGSYYQNNIRPQVELPNLPNGTYKVILATRDLNKEKAPWQPIVAPYGTPNYVMLTVENGKNSITNLEAAHYTVNDVEILTDLYAGANFKIKANITNPSSLQMSEGVTPALYKGAKMMFVGESVLATLNPDETSEMEWVSRFYPMSGVSNPTVATKYQLHLYDPKTTADYGVFGEVTLMPSPGAATVSMRGASFADMATESMEIDGVRYPTVFKVTDKSNLLFSFKYRVTKGYLDGQLIVSLYKMESGVPVPVNDEIYSEWPFLISSNENHNVDVPFSFPEMIDGQLYRITVNYVTNSQVGNLLNVYFMAGQSGIEEIGTEEVDICTEFYNLQGIRVSEPRKGDIIIKRCGSSSKVIRF